MNAFSKFDVSILYPSQIKLHARYIKPFLFNHQNFHINIDGLTLELRPRTYDLYIVAEIFKNHAYQISNLESSSIKTIVDLGANIGLFSLWAANKFCPSLLISVEMDQDNFDLLSKNVSHNHRHLKTKLIKYNNAVYSHLKTVTYQKVALNKGMHSLLGSSNADVHVKTVTLKSLITENHLKNIDLLKIDIEGSEKFLFTQDNQSIFKKQVRNLAMEVHPDAQFSINNVEDYFSSLGFTYQTIKDWRSSNYMFYASNPLSN